MILALTATGNAQRPDPITRIREADLKADLFLLAGDDLRGREGGTLDEMTASMWIAERARQAGLQPAGDNGTYFQFFPLERTRVSATSTVAFDGRALRMGRDVLPDATVLATVDAPVVVVEPAEVAAADVGGKVLAVRYPPPTSTTPQTPGPGQAALRGWLRGIQKSVAAKNPAAVVALVSDEHRDQWARTAVAFTRGTYGLDPDGTAASRTVPRGVPLLYVRESALGGAVTSGMRFTASIGAETFQYPSVNIVAKVPGRDPKLAGEHVLFSAHQDHDGVRYAINGDDIWNGADDNATTSVALLAIGRAMAASPGRRSALFVWHGAEERGLMGSRWYVKHPTVPLNSIVTVLNGDMIGRNDPNTAALLGAVGPHRNSPDLVDMALAANTAVSKFTVDSSWDDPQHREGWYYRSDHLPYARAGIPALFFTTLLHADYHTPFDNPDRIDITKLAKMTRWMYATGRAVAEANEAPALDPDFKLERCRDFTGDYCEPTPAPTQQPAYEPKSGMAGKDVVWVPTPMEVVERMLDMAKVTARDYVVDLGSGDGRNVIAAARRGARATGFEYNPDMVALSRKTATDAGVADRATFVQGDMYEADFSKATVLALFLLPSNLERLKDKILALPPGTRVVLNTFTIDGWEADETDRVGGDCSSWCQVLLHYVPARVDGIWQGDAGELNLSQEFQKVSGVITVNGARVPLESARLRGADFTFTAGGTTYTARVDGNRITGTGITAGSGAKRSVSWRR